MDYAICRHGKNAQVSNLTRKGWLLCCVYSLNKNLVYVADIKFV